MSQPINTGILSYGYSTKVFHGPLISNDPNFSWTAVVERNHEDSKEKYPHLTIYKSVEELLSNEKIELIIVNTPNQTHYEYAKKALMAGKHVIIDKPFAATVNETKELIALAQKQQKMLTAFHNRRWDGDFKIVKQVIESGDLGRLVEAEFKFERYRTSLNPKKHKEEAAPATGLLYEIGTHIIDQAVVLFGKPQGVYADILKLRDNSLVDDYFELILYYPQLRLKLKSTLLAKEELPGYIINGTNGSFVKKRMNLQEDQLKAGMVPGDAGYGEEPEEEWGILNIDKNGETLKTKLPTPSSNYSDFFNLVYDHLRQNGPVPIDPSDALKGIEIIEAAYHSNSNKCVTKL
ncbi:Gfo/Idh/MocA family oxidoreductase [Solitalea sp. MAHUQ-68]|uniref:Gfo/Idh/MocA family oxidoreductase n=1 Tax=Solitalea agri TaxID=2953739 RepID=A0A9X2F1H2_9SPHI|nr:Gfo/Idh/MocA family oxidoreductase [Solitalea agri]MCO4292355.1 Gfo/Idh/MocA family oxidoreductase [Solitalea agri]